MAGTPWGPGIVLDQNERALGMSCDVAKVDRMHSLTEVQFLQEAAAAFTTVFREGPAGEPLRSRQPLAAELKPDAFGEPFQPAVKHRGIVYPGRFASQPSLLMAAAAAARESQDHGVFLSITERPFTTDRQDHQMSYHWHWYFPLTNRAEVEAFVSFRDSPPMEAAIYSPSGGWGILGSAGDHAVIGSSGAFIDAFYAHMPRGAAEQLREFLANCREQYARYGFFASWQPDNRRGWLRTLLIHIYGRERALDLLRMAGLPSEG